MERGKTVRVGLLEVLQGVYVLSIDWAVNASLHLVLLNKIKAGGPVPESALHLSTWVSKNALNRAMKATYSCSHKGEHLEGDGVEGRG